MTKKISRVGLTTVNYHLTEACNFDCGYCFAKYGQCKETLTRNDAFLLIDRLAEAGCKKLTFVGGEPTLCKWLPDLIGFAKRKALTTMIVTNGTGLSDAFLAEVSGILDWIGLSVDSMYSLSLHTLGQISKKHIIDVDFYYSAVDRIKTSGFRLKVNTVVSSVNHGENLAQFINYAMPERWKIFQVLPLTPQSKAFAISTTAFTSFQARHTPLIDQYVTAVFEDNNSMTGSYVMIDPIGRFYDNVEGKHSYSDPILKVGVDNALKQVSVNDEKVLARGGIYDWQPIASPA